MAAIPDPVAPPALGAALVSTPQAAADAAQYATLAGLQVPYAASLLNGVAVAFRGPLTMSTLPAGGRMQALTAGTLACIAVLDAPCSGTGVRSTSVAPGATRVVPGDFVDVTFEALSGSLGAATVGFKGRVRLEFDAALDLASPRLDGLNARIGLTDYLATLNGVDHASSAGSGRLLIDGAGRSTVVMFGARYTALSGVGVAGSGSSEVGSGTLRTAHWTDRDRYIDIALTGWRTQDARPAVGSVATITGASGRVSVVVTQSNIAVVDYLVTIEAGGTTEAYTATSAYFFHPVPVYTARLN